MSKFDFENDHHQLIKQWMDNTDWEYIRVGLGQDEVGLYLVDLDDSGEPERIKQRIVNGLNVDDVITRLVNDGALVAIDDGYDENDTHRVANWMEIEDAAAFNGVLVTGWQESPIE